MVWSPFRHPLPNVTAYEGRAAEAFRSLAEMEAILDRIEHETDPQRPNAVSVEIAGYELCLGLGNERSFVQIQPIAGREGHCWVTLGDEADDGTTVFWLLAWHHTEMDNRWLVSQQLSRKIVRDYLVTGKLCSEARWYQFW
jgi:hypothetical protein